MMDEQTGTSIVGGGPANATADVAGYAIDPYRHERGGAVDKRPRTVVGDVAGDLAVGVGAGVAIPVAVFTAGAGFPVGVAGAVLAFL